MGKFLEKFKSGVKGAKKKMEDMEKVPDSIETDFPDEMPYDDFGDDLGDAMIQPSQKPESFHHFILENQYKDLERSIRGYKDVFDKVTNQWKLVRKKVHCFTDEEAEEILRTAQSHLATDIKLGYVSKESFPLMMDAIYKEIAFLFESIAEYRYGRYNEISKEGKLIKENFELQYQMKLQNHKIFLELFTRVQANYSRSIQGQENKFTHESVKGQESLQQIDNGIHNLRRYT